MLCDGILTTRSNSGNSTQQLLHAAGAPGGEPQAGLPFGVRRQSAAATVFFGATGLAYDAIPKRCRASLATAVQIFARFVLFCGNCIRVHSMSIRG